MAYDGMSKRVKNALKVLLSETQYNDQPAFIQVIGSTHGEFDGLPSVRILPGDLTTEKGAVAENDRTLSYIIRIHLDLENAAAGEATYDHMYDLTDLMIDKLDVGDFTSALNTIDPTLHTYVMNASRGDWFVTESEAGIILMCDINCEVKYSRDLA